MSGPSAQFPALSVQQHQGPVPGGAPVHRRAAIGGGVGGRGTHAGATGQVGVSVREQRTPANLTCPTWDGHRCLGKFLLSGALRLAVSMETSLWSQGLHL